MIKKKYFMCKELYLSLEWHIRTQQGYGTYRVDDRIATMLKPKDEGINGNVIQIQVPKV